MDKSDTSGKFCTFVSLKIMSNLGAIENSKVVYATLGCKLNFSETSAIGRTLNEMGFVKAAKGEQAGLVVVNTCSVTDAADKKCRQTIRQLIKKHPNAKVVVTGCYAQLSPGDIAAIPGVDLIIGSNEKNRLAAFVCNLEKSETATIHTSKLKDIKAFSPITSGDDRTRTFLKIQDGCDYFCTYCTIPFARGLSRSGTIAETLNEAKRAIDRGAIELILTGVNIGDFGRNQGETFYQLLETFDKELAGLRVRVGSVEPNLLTNEMIDLMAESSVIMPHFHIPLQSGSDQMLQIMHRKYNTELFVNKVETIKSKCPDAFIGVDVIAGVNGETDELFGETVDLLTELNISQLHAFSYSERPGTAVLKVQPVVPVNTRHKRSLILQKLSDKKLQAFYLASVGQSHNVLFEHDNHHGKLYGFTENYIRVEHNYDTKLINSTCKVKITDFNTADFTMGSEKI